MRSVLSVSSPLVRLSAQAARMPADSIRFAAAETVSTPRPEVFPVADADFLQLQQRQYTFPEIFVTTVEYGMVTGGTNLVAAGSEMLCHDLYVFSTDDTPDERKHRIAIDPVSGWVQWRIRKHHPTVLPVAAVFTDGLAAHYAHWVTEVLPRLAIFCAEPRFKDVPVIVDAGLHPNIRTSLQMVIGRNRRVIELADNLTVQVDRLLVVSPAGYVPYEPRGPRSPLHSNGRFSPLALRLLRSMLAAAVGKSTALPRKVYLRRQGRVRALVNHAEIEQALTARGFTAFAPEKLSFVEQFRLFANAEVIVGPTGAGFANLVFCQPDANIVILVAKHPDISYWYWQNIACACDLRVKYVLGAIDPRGKREDFHADYTVNVNDVVHAIGG